MSKVILTTDSTCDLTPELRERFGVAALSCMHIVYGDKSYDDGVNIRSAEVFERFGKDGTLPKTAAINVGEYIDFFTPFVEQGYEVVHINLGSSLSSSHSNCKLAAEQVGNVYPVDSQNLSTGTGLLVLAASELIAEGKSAQEVAQEVSAMVPNSHASFILDTLKFLAAGGRCSAVAAFGANLLNIKPSIEVNNQGGGAMGVAKKYRGKFENCIVEYIKDQFARYDNIDCRRVFITHSDMKSEWVEVAKKAVAEAGIFEEVFETEACCTIASHCGPNCIGVLFMTK